MSDLHPGEPDLAHRDTFRFWADERVRFNDLDALGHVNNNAFGVYFEGARIAFMTGIGLRAGPTDPAVVIVHLEIDFRAELHFPADLSLGLGVLRLGTSSITLGLGLFRGETCHATSKAVMTRLDRAIRRATPLTETERALFTPYLIGPRFHD